MKALILAAGFGTRLKPYSDTIPKPLFPIGGRPILDKTIRQLITAGCDGIIINTHHLHGKIEAFIACQDYPVPVVTRYEPVILDTGGAMRNVADFMNNQPFIVVNSDIVTDLDYADIYAYHTGHVCPVTLVLHNYPEFNNVSRDADGFVLGFHLTEKPESSLPESCIYRDSGG